MPAHEKLPSGVVRERYGTGFRYIISDSLLILAEPKQSDPMVLEAKLSLRDGSNYDLAANKKFVGFEKNGSTLLVPKAKMNELLTIAVEVCFDAVHRQ